MFRELNFINEELDELKMKLKYLSINRIKNAIDAINENLGYHSKDNNTIQIYWKLDMFNIPSISDDNWDKTNKTIEDIIDLELENFMDYISKQNYVTDVYLAHPSFECIMVEFDEDLIYSATVTIEEYEEIKDMVYNFDKTAKGEELENNLFEVQELVEEIREDVVDNIEIATLKYVMDEILKESEKRYKELIEKLEDPKTY